MPIRALFVPMLASSAAFAQAADPHVFVANDGNLEGSVSSLRVNQDGSLTLADRVVTGSRASTSQPCAACNAFAIDLSPDGSHLAVNHASGSSPEQITVLRVGTDGTLSVADTVLLPEAGLDIAWVRDDLLAVCVTTLSATNTILLYDWDAGAGTLSLADTEPAGTFLTSIAVHPTGGWVYANDSFGSTVRQFRITASDIAFDRSYTLPVSGVALGVTPDGAYLYAAGGISAGGNAFAGYSINQSTGDLTAIPGSPFTSPGDSPKGFAFDAGIMFVSHGSDATIQAFGIDPESGVPAFTGSGFDVGLQGTLQGMDTLPGSLFALDESDVIDGVEGVYRFDIDAGSGAFTPDPATPVPTGGVSPSDIAAWAGTGVGCPADLAEPFGTLNFFDIAAFIAFFNAGDPSADLAEPFGTLNFFDIAGYIALFNTGCP